MAKFLKKGSLIGVEGRIETGSYQKQDGATAFTTDVIAESVQFLEPKATNDQQNPNMMFGNDEFGRAANSDNQTIDVSDDDLPF